jgi:peptide/nickel transport system substrate-binding protein
MGRKGVTRQGGNEVGDPAMTRKAQRRSKGKTVRRWSRTLTVVVAVGMVATACGGGGKKTVSTSSTSTSTNADASAVTTSTVQNEVSTSTTSAAVGHTTSTTAHATAATTKKSSTSTTAAITGKKVTGGITNITSPPATVPAADIQPGGTITFLKIGDIASLDPIALPNSGSSDGPAASAIFDTLLYSDPIAGQIQPQTASSLTSTDALVWTLKLKPNIKFSDGTPYDAAAVKFNWQRLQDPKNTASRASLANLISGLDVIDSVTLKITLKLKNAVFSTEVALIPFVGSPTAITTEGAGFASAPVGAGPFLLKSWVRDSQVNFVRNPTYWNAPRPYVDQLVFKFILDETQRANTMISGDGNLTQTITPSTAAQLQSAGEIPTAGVLNGGTLMYFNLRKPPFNDIRVRQAVEMAVDRTDFAKVVDSGVVDPMDSIFRKTSPYYDANILQPAYDPAKAQQLLDAYASDTGKPLTFTLTTFSAGNYPPAAQYIQGALMKLKNINVSVQVEATTAHIAAVNTGAFTAALFGTPFDDPEPTWTSLYTCDANPSPSGFCDTKFDADIADNRVTLDANQRIADLKDAQKVVYAQLPSFFFERRETWLFETAQLQNVQWANDGLPLFDRMWIKGHS